MKLKTNKYEAQLSSIMLDVVVRVEQLRPEAAELALGQLEQFELLKSDKCEALNALLFIIGEFGGTLSPENQAKSLELVLKDRWKLLNFPESVQNALTSATFKLSLKIRSLNKELFDIANEKLEERSKQVDYMESQERSLLYINVVKNLNDAEIADLGNLIEYLTPVPSYTQSMVFAPESMLVPIDIDENEIQTRNEDGSVVYHYFRDEDFVPNDGLTDEQRRIIRKQIRDKQQDDPFYIKTKKKGKKKGKKKRILESVPNAEEEKKEEAPLPKPNAEKKYTVVKDPTAPHH